MKLDERAVLREKRSLSEDAFLLTFDGGRSAAAAPGQFTMLRLCEPALVLRRPYSFCHLDSENGRFTILVKTVGRGTRALAALPPGEGVFCLGPLGTSFTLPPAGTRIVMVAGGVGIAPFVALAQWLAREGRAGTVLLGGRRAADLYLRDDFERMGMEVYCATEDGSAGTRGRVTALLHAAISGTGPSALFSCGPSAMLAAVAVWARERAIPHQVAVERRMGCGMGCCLGCVVLTKKPSDERAEYRRACTEGPVFDAAEICWDRDLHPL